MGGGVRALFVEILNGGLRDRGEGLAGVWGNVGRKGIRPLDGVLIECLIPVKKRIDSLRRFVISLDKR